MALIGTPASSFNPHSPGTIGDVTPGSIFATSVVASGQIESSANIFSGGSDGNAIGATGRWFLTSYGASQIQLWNATFDGAPLLQFGGHVNTFPAIKRVGTTLQVRLADDSDFGSVQGKITTAAAAVTGLVAGALAALTTATIVIYDSTGTPYRVPCLTP